MKVGHIQLQRPATSMLPSPPVDKSTSIRRGSSCFLYLTAAQSSIYVANRALALLSLGKRSFDMLFVTVNNENYIKACERGPLLSIETFYRDSWVEIRLDAIKENMKQLQRTLDDKTGVYAVVKANAYGHGDVQVAQAALEAGAYGLAVSLLDEALILREAGVEAPILVMGWVRPEDAAVAVKYNITLTAFQTEWVQAVKNQSYEGTLSLHLKWDTGMGRIGVRTQEELHELLLSCQDERFKIDGIFTHFATADEVDLSYFHKQQERFEILLKEFNRHWDGSTCRREAYAYCR